MWKVSTTMELIESCALLSNEEQFSFPCYITNAPLVTYEHIRSALQRDERFITTYGESDRRNSRSVSS